VREILDAAAGSGSGFAMPCLPMATEPGLRPGFTPSLLDPEIDERSLARAFASFTEAAVSLERSYSQLHTEVARLRRELEETNRDLALSLEENRRIRHRLNRILEGLPCGVLVTEVDGSVSISNPETQRLLGSPRVPPALAARFETVRSQGGELECRLDEDKPGWITICHAQLSAEDGGSSIFILQDITRLKRLQQEHEALLRRQALAEMSAVLAHEIRNPLGSLELFAGLLAESELAAEEREWVEHLQAGLRALAATVNNVLQFHSQPQPGLAPTDLGPLLHAITEFLRPLAQRAHVHLAVMPGFNGIWVAADRHRLEQVLLNLALNSFHFMPGGGVLWISGGSHPLARPGSMCIEITDTGSGIAPENLQRIFEPGFTTRPGSPGLGLAVCQTILQQHGGEIHVSSQPGRGATFTLVLPLLAGALLEKTNESRSPS